MHAALLYQLTGEPNKDEIESHLGSGFPAIDADGTQYLDGRTLYHGVAAGRIESETRVPVVTDDAILMEKDYASEQLKTEWYVDLEEGWAGIDTSDGEFFLELLQESHGVISEEMQIGLEAWARDFVQRDSAYCWGLSYSEGDDNDPIRAGAGFHADASIDSLRENAADVSAIGFSYKWGGDDRTRGIICESGYVAIYRDWPAEKFARWLADEVMPFTVYDTRAVDQSTLGDSQEECDRCGRETDLQDYDDGQYCAVCIDYFEDDETGTDAEDGFENLDTVNVTDGGQNDA